MKRLLTTLLLPLILTACDGDNGSPRMVVSPDIPQNTSADNNSTDGHQHHYLPIPDSAHGPALNEHGYYLGQAAEDVYWVTEGAYQAMFITTEEGVVVVDAPPTIGDKLLSAVAEVTDLPITHVIYSHSHADHIAAANIYPANATYIAHQETKNRLERSQNQNYGDSYGFGLFVGGGEVPLPQITFEKDYQLNIGGKTIELIDANDAHIPGNLYIHLPDEKVMMVVDIIYPNWTPFGELAQAENIPSFVQAHEDLLHYDYDVLISGHLGNVGNKDDVIKQQAYIHDIIDNAATALQTTDFVAVTGGLDQSNTWLIYEKYLEAAIDQCTELTLTTWADQLAASDVFTKSHCVEVVESLRID